MSHLVDHHKNHHLVNDSTLHVIGVVSNVARYQSRYRLAREWYERMLSTENVKVYLVETAFGDRHHEVTDASDPTHLQLRTNQEIWHKEAMINLGVRHLLHSDWKYVAWVDTDVEFRRKDWALESIHKLQHHFVLQPWSNCLDLSHDGNVMQTHTSLGYIQQNGHTILGGNSLGGKFPHTGYAWCARRELWESMQGLPDFAILGSGDYHSAHAFCGNVDATLNRKVSESYKRRCKVLEKRSTRLTKGYVGYVDGVIEHNWHGSKRNRFYKERWQILVDNNYDPDQDLVYDAQGLPMIVGKPQLLQDVNRYNAARNEDAI